MLSTARTPKAALHTPNRGPKANAKAPASSAMPSVVIGEEAYSVFGENGDSIIEDLMRTDDQIMNIISESNGAMETLLGSVFSPAQVAGLASPHVSAVLMSPAGQQTLMSPRASPRNLYSLAWSPHPPTSESIRRSARITPTRGLFPRDRDVMDFDTPMTPRSAALHDRDLGKRKTPSSRKALKMGGGGNGSEYQDFEDYVLPPLSPFTPYENTEREGPAGGKAKLSFPSTDKKSKTTPSSTDDDKDAAKKAAAAAAASGSKRGEYKCGKCGFFPKKEKHDCNAYKKKCLMQGIEIQMRHRKGGGSKKKVKQPKGAKAGKTPSSASRPILTTLQTNKPPSTMSPIDSFDSLDSPAVDIDPMNLSLVA